LLAFLLHSGYDHGVINSVTNNGNSAIVMRELHNANGVIQMAIKTMTINEVSERIGISPRTIRKVLRANFDETPGRGGRYAIAESDIPALTEM